MTRLLAVVLAAVQAVNLEFLEFMSLHGKSYATLEELQYRAKLYEKTSLMIDEINQAQDTHVAGHNRYSDWSEQELTRLYNNIDDVSSKPELITTNTQ